MRRFSKVFYILIILLCIGCTKNKEIPKKESKEDIINSIISYDNNYEYDFLNYIYNNYGEEVINKINNSLSFLFFILATNIFHVYTATFILRLSIYFLNINSFDPM